MKTNSSTLKKTLCLVCLAVLVCLLTFGFFGGSAQADAVEWDDSNDKLRILANVALAINGGNGYVWATAKTTSNLFSTIKVTVELYCSETPCTSYEQMQLVATNSIAHLGLGKTLECKASTNGKQMYWMGRMVYKFDNNPQQYMTTKLCLYSANGEFLGNS